MRFIASRSRNGANMTITLHNQIYLVWQNITSVCLIFVDDKTTLRHDPYRYDFFVMFFRFWLRPTKKYSG